MKKNNRKQERYDDYGRVDCPKICALSGILDDISLSGCKAHFPIMLSVDKDDEYILSIRSSNKYSASQLTMIAHIQWSSFDGQNTSVGFQFLRSPDTPKLASYISLLKDSSENDDNISKLIIASSVDFVKA